MPSDKRNDFSGREPALRIPHAQLQAELDERLILGQRILERSPVSKLEQLTQLRADFESWDEFNMRLLRSRFSTTKVADEYKIAVYVSGGRTLAEKEAYVKGDIASQRRKLESIRNQIPLFEAALRVEQNSISKNVPDRIFIGHGRSGAWRELKDYIRDRLGLEFEEFNRISIAGIATTERLVAMLDNSSMALLVCTAEDEHSGGSQHARENVVHEAGLFQGRLGFRRAIVLLEEGCTEFSNIHGLGQIRFPRGNIGACFEQIREVLEREGLLSV